MKEVKRKSDGLRGQAFDINSGTGVTGHQPQYHVEFSDGTADGLFYTWELNDQFQVDES